MGNGCVQHVWFAQNGALIVRLTRDMHKRAIIARIIYALEKTIYGLKKTIYGLERLFTAQKRLFTAWDYFCRIVSLFLITWRTFNQSMNKNIWMPYIIKVKTCINFIMSKQQQQQHMWFKVHYASLTSLFHAASAHFTYVRWQLWPKTHHSIKKQKQGLLQPQGELYPIQTIFNHRSQDQLLEFRTSFYKISEFPPCPREFQAHSIFTRAMVLTPGDSNSQPLAPQASAVSTDLTWQKAVKATSQVPSPCNIISGITGTCHTAQPLS